MWTAKICNLCFRPKINPGIQGQRTNLETQRGGNMTDENRIKQSLEKFLEKILAKIFKTFN
jgi:hypothetical protein